MGTPTRDDLLIQLNQLDTALEAPEADKAALLRDAHDWLAANTPAEAGDALYYRERLQAIAARHGGAG